MPVPSYLKGNQNIYWLSSQNNIHTDTIYINYLVMQVYLKATNFDVDLQLQTKYRDLVGSSNENFAVINSYSISKCSSIVNLNIDILLVDIGTLITKTIILKV